MFYYDTHWHMWVRRLLTLQGKSIRFIDIFMTGVNNDWSEVMEERIRVHHTLDKGKMVDELPDNVYSAMVAKLGGEMTIRLMTFNYIKHFGLARILKADANHKTGGGVPVNQI